jgi:uncharacterized protein YbcV (DUF1398 family)
MDSAKSQQNKENLMNVEVIHNAMAGSLAGTTTFPEVVQALAAESVERYNVDLVRMEKTTYMPDGENDVHPFDFSGAVAEEFSATAVLSAILAIQSKQIRYREFLKQIMAAGCTGYGVYIGGAKAIYFGRKGEFHVEEFPSAK